MNKLRIIFAGGGTGGHIYPIIAVSEKLRAWTEKNGVRADFRYFGNPGAFREVLTANNIRVSRVAESKWRRYFSLLNFLDIFKFGFSIAQCLWKVYWFMPNVDFSKGGPGSLPVVLVSFFYGIPIVIHESDSVPGLANRLGSRFARVVELAFSSAAKHLPKTTAKLSVVGNPVRSELLSRTSPEQAKTELGFIPAKPLILIFGGSQGSNRMNDFIIGN